jgi:hypothetical protein
VAYVRWPSMPAQKLRRHAQLPAPSASMPTQESRRLAQTSAAALMANAAADQPSAIGSLPGGAVARAAGQACCPRNVWTTHRFPKFGARMGRG